MESSRRPPLENKSGELGLKRPRAAAGANLSSRTSVAASSRLRSNGRGKDSDGASNDPVRGPLPEPPLHHHRELVSQYKNALSELIFNSKPIITNLTIIAGENSHAAKAVAATICAHILEVPSDQKLPSLYLLDSIVKNIGRDYVKHFAPRLPEVFIKVYRHADPSIHPAMRHLFGTWKGVFPFQSLQLIDKELGLSPAANGSLSGSTTSVTDSQSQHQPHSIHINPRYLEERQRLQQSSRPKGSANNVGDAYITSTAEVERPDKTASVGAERLWRDGSNKSVLRPRRELKNNIPEKLSSAKSEDLDYSTCLPRPLSSRLGKVNARIPEQAYNKRWFSGKSDVKVSITSPGNGYDSRHGTLNYSASRSASVPSGADMSSSWKNSEEEEFSWDDLNPCQVDHAAANSTREEHWDIEDLDDLEFEKKSQPEAEPMNEREILNDILTGEQRELVTFEQQRSSPWPLCDQSFAESSDLLHHKKDLQAISLSLGLSSSDVAESAGSIVQHQQSTGKPLIQPYLSTSSFSARDPRLMFAEKEHVASKHPQADRKISALSGQLGLGVCNKKIQDSVAPDPNLPLERERNFEAQTARKKTPVTAYLQSRHLGLVSPELPDSCTQAELQVLQPNASTLLAAVMKSGILSSLSPPSYDLSRSTLPGPEFEASSSSSFPCVDPKSQGPALVVPGSPSLQSSSRNQSSNHTSPSSNPFSSLLNTLMAKGLISTSESEDATRSRSDLSQKPSETRPVLGMLKCVKASTVSDSSPSITQSATGEVTCTKSWGQMRETSPEMKKRAARNLIGLEFKSHVLREFHSEVVDGIFLENHPHFCGICGIRLKLKERVERHMEWHSMMTSSEQGKSNVPWRRWYANSEDWIAGNVGLPICCDPAAGSLGESCEATGKEEIEPMVAADERQCVCLLCGELFEDIYSEEEEEWMFKGAVNMKIRLVSGGKEGVPDQNSRQGVIVHGKCASDYADRDLGLPDGVKLEEDVQ